jgi:hypothetical protein
LAGAPGPQPGRRCGEQTAAPGPAARAGTGISVAAAWCCDATEGLQRARRSNGCRCGDGRCHEQFSCSALSGLAAVHGWSLPRRRSGQRAFLHPQNRTASPICSAAPSAASRIQRRISHSSPPTAGFTARRGRPFSQVSNTRARSLWVPHPPASVHAPPARLLRGRVWPVPSWRPLTSQQSSAAPFTPITSTTLVQPSTHHSPRPSRAHWSWIPTPSFQPPQPPLSKGSSRCRHVTTPSLPLPESVSGLPGRASTTEPLPSRLRHVCARVRRPRTVSQHAQWPPLHAARISANAVPQCIKTRLCTPSRPTQ